MKKIGISTYQLQRRFGDTEALEIASKVGADAVDFDLCSRDNDFRKADSLYSKGKEAIVEYYGRIKEKADELGIIISQTHGKLEGLKNVDADDEALLKNLELDLFATSILGAPVCVVHTTTTIFLGPDAPSEKMHELNYKLFTSLLPKAKEYGVKIATETFGDAVRFKCCDFFGNAHEFVKGYQAVKASPFGEWFTVCVDTGHSNKATRFDNPSAADVIRMIGGDISVLHLNDNDTLTDQHKPPLTGSINWTDVLDALDEVGYDGVYNMEISLNCFGEELMCDTAELAVKIMRNLLNKR